MGIGDLQWHIHGVALYLLRPGQIGINMEMLVFVEGGKPEHPVKTPCSRPSNQQQMPPTNVVNSGI